MLDSISWFQLLAQTLLEECQGNIDFARTRVSNVLPGRETITLTEALEVIATESRFPSWEALLKASEIERCLAVVMLKERWLNDLGMGLSCDRSLSADERLQNFRADRERLRKSVDDVAWTVEWLRANIKPIASINPHRSSYGLKHIAERESPNFYLTNGVFITAALIAGYRHRVHGFSLNPSFGMSERSIKVVDRRTRHLSRERFARRLAQGGPA